MSVSDDLTVWIAGQNLNIIPRQSYVEQGRQIIFEVIHHSQNILNTVELPETYNMDGTV